jgi:hypothetical protein
VVSSNHFCADDTEVVFGQCQDRFSRYSRSRIQIKLLQICDDRSCRLGGLHVVRQCWLSSKTVTNSLQTTTPTRPVPRSRTQPSIHPFMLTVDPVCSLEPLTFLFFSFFLSSPRVQNPTPSDSFHCDTTENLSCN